MIYSLELKIVQDGIAVRKLPNVFLAEISILICVKKGLASYLCYFVM